MFLQIHTLTSHHASLLNRDDAGLAKRIPFGDKTRLRISSQCLKRHWRGNLQETVPLPSGLRTRHFFEREIYDRLVKKESVNADLAMQLTVKLISLLLQKSDKPKDEKPKKAKKASEDQLELELSDDKAEETLETSGLLVKQPILFGKPEADFLVALLKECADQGEDAEKELQAKLKTDKANFKAMLRQAGFGSLYAGLEGALFGRFVTSDILARSDAAVHVAHAFTVHGLDTEVDFFTVVDDLNLDEETGAAHAGDMELGAGLFYGYVAVDIPLLVSNLTGCEAKDWKQQDFADTRTVLAGLIEAIATVSPGAKLGSTAPYAYSDFVLLEAGTKQPRGLSNAYLQALPTHGDLMQASVNALGNYLNEVDGMYGKTAQHRYASTIKQWTEDTAPRKPLAEAVQSILDGLFGA